MIKPKAWNIFKAELYLSKIHAFARGHQRNEYLSSAQKIIHDKSGHLSPIIIFCFDSLPILISSLSLKWYGALMTQLEFPWLCHSRENGIPLHNFSDFIRMLKFSVAIHPFSHVCRWWTAGAHILATCTGRRVSILPPSNPPPSTSKSWAILH